MHWSVVQRHELLHVTLFTFRMLYDILVVLHWLYSIFASSDIHQSPADVSIVAPLLLELVTEIWWSTYPEDLPHFHQKNTAGLIQIHHLLKVLLLIVQINRKKTLLWVRCMQIHTWVTTVNGLLLSGWDSHNNKCHHKKDCFDTALHLSEFQSSANLNISMCK